MAKFDPLSATIGLRTAQPGVASAGSGAGAARGLWQACWEAPQRLLLALILWHLLFWVIAPALSYRMLPLDTLELLGWGMEWQWGYYKHPPLGAWLGELSVQLAGGWLPSLYLLAQLVVVVALVYVWLTARRLLDPQRAVLATVLLEGTYWFTYLTPNFNMNTLQLPIWAGFSYHLLRALGDSPRHWLAVGLFAALALLAKYSGLLLLASAVVVLLVTARGRAAWRQPWLYAGACVALLVLTPHLLWLREHWQLPVQYLGSFNAAEESPSLAMHLIEPLRFAAGALLGLLFAALLFLCVIDLRRPRPRVGAEGLIVLILLFGPLLLSMFYGVVSGSRLKSTWAFPFFGLAGVAAFLYLPTRVDAHRWRRVLIGLAAVTALTGGAHLAYKSLSERSKTGFDGAALAQAVESEWRTAYAAPLRIVVGDHILTAIASGYALSRPSMLIGNDFARSPWLTPDALQRHGAAVLCPAGSVCFPELTAEASARRLQVDGQDFALYLLAPQTALAGSITAPSQSKPSSE